MSDEHAPSYGDPEMGCMECGEDWPCASKLLAAIRRHRDSQTTAQDLDAVDAELWGLLDELDDMPAGDRVRLRRWDHATGGTR